MFINGLKIDISAQFYLCKTVAIVSPL